MINPKDLLDANVEKLRAIPGFVAALGGNAGNILAYSDLYPHKASLLHAIQTMHPGQALLFWSGAGPGQFGRNEVWQNNFSLVLRSPEDRPDAYHDLWYQFCNGVPTGDADRFRYINIHPLCYPMDTPRIERKMLALTEQTFLDYFEITYSLKERGDS